MELACYSRVSKRLKSLASAPVAVHAGLFLKLGLASRYFPHTTGYAPTYVSGHAWQTSAQETVAADVCNVSRESTRDDFFT